MTHHTFRRAAPYALIIGAVIPALLIAMHATGHDLASDPGGAVVTINLVVHSVMITALPLLFVGLLGPSHRLRGSDLAVAAPVVFRVTAFCGIAAAIMSGFVAPRLLEGTLSGNAGGVETRRILGAPRGETQPPRTSRVLQSPG